MALRSYSALDILLPTIIIIIQECSQALEIRKCLWSLSCGGVPNMVLVLSITFHFNYYIYGVVCVQLAHFSLGDWEDISIAHVTIIIKSEVSTLPIIIFFRGCVPEILVTSYSVTYWIYIPGNRDFVFIIIVQFMMNANSQIRFGLQLVFVCLYITPSHYHHCANLSEDIELIKCLSDIICRVCEKD